ncbi:MAG TPA: hypothetical protein VGF24_28600 [Vicinamibacterales bacterium]
MLAWVRSHSRFIAAPTLVAVMTLTIWSAAPHGDGCHEHECAAVVPPHDASSHRLGRESATEQRPLHCVLCHWTRLVRPPASTAHHVERVVDAGIVHHEESSVAPAQVFAARPPLRAPPASPASA